MESKYTFFYTDFFTENFQAEKEEELIEACMINNIELVKDLIAQGADINWRHPEYGDTALGQAAFKGYIEIVDLLLQYPLTQYSKDIALIFASQAGGVEHVQIMDKLITAGANVNADANMSIGYFNPPLHQTIAKNKSAAFDKLLNAEKIDIDLEDKDSRTPLLLAAYNNRLDMFKALVEKGADLTKQNKEGWTAEYMAKMENNTEILEYIDIKMNISGYKK